MDVKNFIIKEFGLPEDVGFDKCPKITYFDIYELLTKFADELLKQEPDIDIAEMSFNNHFENESKKQESDKQSEGIKSKLWEN